MPQLVAIMALVCLQKIVTDVEDQLMELVPADTEAVASVR